MKLSEAQFGTLLKFPTGSLFRMIILGGMKCTVYDPEVMGLNPGWVELRVHGPSV